MERLLPASFTELLGGLLLVAALVVAMVSVSRRNRAPTTRMSALLLIASLCLFSHSAWVYFTGVIIIALTVSETGFLDNLACLIRGVRRHDPPRRGRPRGTMEHLDETVSE
jgi:hypothetical protein